MTVKRRRKPSTGRPLIQINTSGVRKPAAKRKRSSAAALGRRLGVWAAKGAGRLAVSAATHGASTASRVSSRAYQATALRREERRLHGYRPAVRDLTDPNSSPLSLSQARSHLLGLDQQRENATAKAEQREPRRIAWAEPDVHLPTQLLERIDAPVQLSRRERRQLARTSPGWGPLAVAQLHDRTSDGLEQQRRTEAEVRNALYREPHEAAVRTRPADPGERPAVELDRITRGGTMQEPTTHEALTNPAIDPAQWEEELPHFLRAVADQLVAQWVEAAGVMSEYFRGAQTPGEIQGPVDEFHQALESAREQAERMASAAEEYVASLQLPHFEKVS